MLVGIVGAPNKGKSTLFAALTMSEVDIADYPFTTINPNFGVAYVTRECADKKLSVKCNARNSSCVNGTRMIPVNIVDVAGLVEGAHEGKGMGNRFLSDLAASDALIVVVDASGKTDAAGNPCEGCNPLDDVRMIKNELVEWIAGIIKKHIGSISRRTDGVNALMEMLAGLKVKKQDIEEAAAAKFLSTSKINWPDDSIREFSSALLEKSKPLLFAANKMDVDGSDANFDKLVGELGKEAVVGCSAAIELALRKAAGSGTIDYTAGSDSFNIVNNDVTPEQASALDYMKRFMKSKGTNVQEVLNRAVFGILEMIVVYPVEDENKYADHSGNVLPDAILLKRGSTALDLAAAIHTDIAANMLYAVDAVSKRRLAKDYVLNDNDVIRIVSAAKK